MDGGNEYRGPKIGDSASLWNFSPSPGWTKPEAAILRLCLLKFGVGRWTQIQDSGLLQGKLIQQLNGQTQRLLGQQSLSAYTGLRVDIDRIRQDNDARTGVERKAGLIIWSGKNPTKEMKARWQDEAQQRYGLSEEQIEAAGRELEEATAALQVSRKAEAAAALPDSLMTADVAALSRDEKLELLRALRAAMKQMHEQLLLEPAQGAAAAPDRGGSGARSLPLQDVSNGSDRSGGGAAPHKLAAGKPAGGSKRSRAGGVIARAPRQDAGSKPQRSGPARAKSSSWRRGGVDVHEAPPNAAAEEARAAAIACDMARLEAMGFEPAKAREALEETNCDVDAAIEWLLVSCV